MKASILLEDGTIIQGSSFGAEGTCFGEIVFNTGMTGYQEILTDPSYAGQIVVMTYPLIGNYGINTEDVESDSVKVNGFIVKQYSDIESNWKSNKNLTDYLKENNIPGIADIDTRALTKKIRNQGAMNCLITTEDITDELKTKLKEFTFPNNVVAQVSRPEKLVIKGTGKRIGVIDLGIKSGIIKQFSNLNCELHIYPWNTDAKTLLSENFDAVFFSNGPGDPKEVAETIETAKQLIGKLPIFCICLGHQVLSLALGADTYKLKFGHRGANHPVQDIRTNKVMITSQNHGYAVCGNSLPENMQVTHININDRTIEGFSSPELNIHSVQFHPEAGPGPNDANYIFQEWLNLIGENK